MGPGVELGFKICRGQIEKKIKNEGEVKTIKITKFKSKIN